MKIAMVAPYNIKDKKSWSGTPWSLYDGLCSYENNQIETLNLSEYHTQRLIKKNVFDFIDIKRSIKEKHPVSKLGPAWMNPLNSRILDEICQKNDYDVLIEFGGFLPGKNLPPYYIYTDASHDMSIDYYKEHGQMPYHNHFSFEEMKRASEFVRPIYQNAAGVFCMSDFLAKSMIETTGVDKSRVHTVYAGANWHGVNLPEIQPKSIKGKEKFDVILTGIDYYRKGIDLAVDAFEILYKKYGNKYKLHLCGADKEVPRADFIVDHGFADKNQLVKLLQACDLFVLPSRFDCFGIAFVEAMTFGLPCIGRNACAMPEMIDRGVNGELIEDDNPEALAQLVEKICSDEELYALYSKKAIEKSKKFTWENVSADVMKVIEADIKKK